MKPVFAMGTVVLLAARLVTASPVPAESRKPAAFPAGKYVLGGEKDAARGDDAMELTKTFRLKPNQYVLSGGPSPADRILVDDDLEVLQGGRPLFVDDDHVRSDDPRDSFAGHKVTYRGWPVVLVLDPAKKVRLRATDHFGSEAILGPVWVHRWDGARKKLTAGKTEDSAPNLPNVFFDESFSLADGFELPERVATDPQTELPEKPAALLPRFRPAAPRPGGGPRPAAPNANEFVKVSVLAGLKEDGVPPALAARLAENPDFVPKCPLCEQTRSALREYAKVDKAPAPRDGMGLPTELAKGLDSKDPAVRRAALRDLVTRYVERGYDRAEMTPDQRAGLEGELRKMQFNPKGGMLPGGLPFCPSCNGATCTRPAAGL